MSLTKIKWTETIDTPWIDVRAVGIGAIPVGRGTPERYLLVTIDEQPILRVDAYANSEESYTFKEAIRWGNFVVIGWGNRVYLVRLDSFDVSEHLLDAYFGHLYASDDYLLVASAERLFRLACDGSVEWKSELLGIDGVVVKCVEAGMISGEGEWDPPGGWKPFLIGLDSGCPV